MTFQVIVVLDHFETGADSANRHIATLESRGTQRQLNAEGVVHAVEVGDAFGRHTRVDGPKLPPSKNCSDDDTMPVAGEPEISTQGEAVILRPDGKDGFVVVASLRLAFWRASNRK